MKKISLCVPVYNESENLDEFYTQTKQVFDTDLANYELELLFINDGSTDDSLEQLQEMNQKDPRVQVLDLSRNYGKEIAMYAGLDTVTGDCVVILDSDLQHPISKIPEMVALWEMGYQDVYGKIANGKKHSFFKRLTSKAYYKVLSFLSGAKAEDGVGDFRLLDREFIDAIISVKDKQRYTKGLYGFVGFKKVCLEYEHQERYAGDTKWNTKQLAVLAIEGITSNSVKPLQISTILGFIISMISFIYLFITVIRAWLGYATVDGYPSLMAVILMLGGIQLLSIGILGTYIGKVYTETKDRPLYFTNKQTSKLNKKNK